MAKFIRLICNGRRDVMKIEERSCLKGVLKCIVVDEERLQREQKGKWEAD